MGMSLEIKDIKCGFGPRVVVNGFNATVNSGEILCMLDRTASAKAPFKTVLGFLKPMGGEILLDGKAINTLSRKGIR